MRIGIGGRASFSPLALFTAGEQGFIYDPSDFTTLYQDNAGTTPVTAVGQTVGLVLDKSGRGNHATQSVLASRPILAREPLGGRRNLLLRSQEFGVAPWQATNAGTGTQTISANGGLSPIGDLTADRLQLDLNGGTTSNDATRRRQAVTVSGGNYTFSVWLRSFDGVSTYTVGIQLASTVSAVTVTGEWQRFYITVTLAAGSVASDIFIRGAQTPTHSPSADLLVWGAQLETGSTATAYQRVTSVYDVTEAGKADLHYLLFDGSDDFLVTPTITPGTDKVQVFAGVRKLSDAARGSVLGFSTAPNASNGSFEVFAPGLDAEASYGIASRGTTQASTRGTTFTAPITNVFTGLGDISGDSAILRVNGTQANSSAADQGTGNYLAYPHYIGRRGGVSLPFNGRLYGLITRFGPNLSDAQIAQTEQWLNQKTGAY